MVWRGGSSFSCACCDRVKEFLTCHFRLDDLEDLIGFTIHYAGRDIFVDMREDLQALEEYMGMDFLYLHVVIEFLNLKIMCMIWCRLIRTPDRHDTFGECRHD